MKILRIAMPLLLLVGGIALMLLNQQHLHSTGYIGGVIIALFACLMAIGMLLLGKRGIN